MRKYESLAIELLEAAFGDRFVRDNTRIFSFGPEAGTGKSLEDTANLPPPGVIVEDLGRRWPSWLRLRLRWVTTEMNRPVQRDWLRGRFGTA